MSALWAVLICLIIWLLYEQRKKCLREGKPFLRLGLSSAKAKKISFSEKTRLQYGQPLGNRPKKSIHKEKSFQAKPRSSSLQSQSTTKETKKKTVDRALWQKLNALTHDPETTNRLIRNTVSKNPEKTVDWSAERAIWTLERDRQ